MNVLSKYHPHSFWLFCALRSLDLLIDKQELIKKKVLKANGLCGSGTMGRQCKASVRRQNLRISHQFWNLCWNIS